MDGWVESLSGFYFDTVGNLRVFWSIAQWTTICCQHRVSFEWLESFFGFYFDTVGNLRVFWSIAQRRNLPLGT